VVGSGVIIANVFQAVSDWIEAGNTTLTNTTAESTTSTYEEESYRTFVLPSNATTNAGSAERLDGEDKDGKKGLFGQFFEKKTGSNIEGASRPKLFGLLPTEER
jgi:hypothetical protein